MDKLDVERLTQWLGFNHLKKKKELFQEPFNRSLHVLMKQLKGKNF